MFSVRAALRYLDFLRDYGQHFTINRMMNFESVKMRLDREQPLTFLEFNYMILQVQHPRPLFLAAISGCGLCRLMASGCPAGVRLSGAKPQVQGPTAARRVSQTFPTFISRYSLSANQTLWHISDISSMVPRVLLSLTFVMDDW